MDVTNAEDIVTVANFSEPADAHLALSVLQGSGIHAFLSGEESNSLLPTALGARLQVLRKDEAIARALLTETAPEASLTDDGNNL